MAALQFSKAVKYNEKGRIALIGTAGSGKTYSALNIAQYMLQPGQRIAVIDTEHGSSRKYADFFDFDILQLTDFDPDNYVAAIHVAEKAGYGVLVIDGLSHAWAGKGGLLEFVDTEAAKSGRRDAFSAWRKATPKHNDLVEAMLACQLHLIVTMRSKMEYVIEKYDEGGREKTRIRKVGLQPIQREGLDYEFDVVGDIDAEHNLVIGKTRCSQLDGKVFHKPGKEFADIVMNWLTGAAKPEPKPEPPRANGQEPPKVPAGNGNGTPPEAPMVFASADEAVAWGMKHSRDGKPIFRHQNHARHAYEKVKAAYLATCQEESVKATAAGMREWWVADVQRRVVDAVEDEEQAILSENG
jgi:hypothetical protein